MNEHERLLWTYTLAVSAWLEAIDVYREHPFPAQERAVNNLEKEVRELTALHLLPVPPVTTPTKNGGAT